jgi:tRNA threonylcarbamoyl adenosine modification protein YeaZ
MIGLAIHTSSPALGLALSDFEQITRTQTWNFGRDLSMHLHTTLADFVQPYAWADLSFLAVARGPGGFTGTRIGVVTARTLAQQLNIPLFGISSLAALAQSVVDQTPDLDLAATPALAVDLKAQREMRFTALYQPAPDRLKTLQAERVISPAEWEQTLAEFPGPIHAVTATEDMAQTVAQVLSLAYQDWQAGHRPHWAEVVPYYGQHPVD